MWESRCIEIHTNSVLDVQRTPIGEVVEPITAAEARNYLKISTDFDDPELTSLIKQGREWIEKRCGISVIHYDCTAIIQVLNSQELPYGPVSGPFTIVNAAGNTVPVNAYNLSGIDYPRFIGYGRFTVRYRSGFEEVPEEIKGAIKSYVAFYYENRGDNIYTSNDKRAVDAREKIDPFKRTIGF